MNVERIMPLLYVADVARSLALYQDLLGFETVGRMDEGGKPVWVQLRSPGGAGIMINHLSGGVTAPPVSDDAGCVLYLAVESVHAVVKVLRGAGYEVADPEAQAYGLDQIWVRDPDGFPLCFTSPTDLSRRGAG